MDFVDFALLANTKAFVSLKKIAEKFRNYTLESIRKRLSRLCALGLIETVSIKGTTYYRITKKGCKAFIKFYKENEMDEIFELLKSIRTSP